MVESITAIDIMASTTMHIVGKEKEVLGDACVYLAEVVPMDFSYESVGGLGVISINARSLPYALRYAAFYPVTFDEGKTKSRNHQLCLDSFIFSSGVPHGTSKKKRLTVMGMGIENGEFAGVDAKVSVLQSHISLKFALQTICCKFARYEIFRRSVGSVFEIMFKSKNHNLNVIAWI
ncbi:hypothetical protein G5I_01117 [Acromyrmex echinatior]|uniref:Uncharacterized protein n=1 Tax=Acromyrmex echinatior TaxID=103372 RepID=F4W6M2_ACREC|nr:hypothetical protein G5I_01117 [Acromyrmex echinatior]